MNKFYNGNSLYNFIDDVKAYYFTREDKWILIYGNKCCEPKLLFLLSSYTREHYLDEKLTLVEDNFMKYIKQLSEISDVPYLYVRFNSEDDCLKSVFIMKDGKYRLMNLDEYRKLLVEYGLPISPIKSYKQINKHFSNIYQIWQMQNGLGIVSSDIDLFRVDASSKKILSIYELKRSYIDLDKWKPYPADYHNFQLISNLLKNTNVNFYIVYNKRVENPFEDKIDYLHLFDMKNICSNQVIDLGICSLVDFFNRKY